ncbi:MAG: metallophosphoesterase [Alphaproteobacteria bacterium]|nr:metallophosphoesterase [Alphaproteobacteria bacterium]
MKFDIQPTAETAGSRRASKLGAFPPAWRSTFLQYFHLGSRLPSNDAIQNNMLKFADTDFEGQSGFVDQEHREQWGRQRRAMEEGLVPSDLQKRLRTVRERAFKFARRAFENGLREARLYERGIENAVMLQRTDFDMMLDGLPKALDGYRIAHITDCHFDTNPGLLARLKGLVYRESVDLCVFTGDYQDNRKCPQASADAAAALVELIATFEQRDGALAVLGNHDRTDIVEPLEAQGIRVLANEWVTVPKGRDQLVVTGLDDVHYFETPMAYRALAAAPEGFRIVLVHSPDAAHAASLHQHDLYLCGHTHGGQICLPGGRPIITNQRGHPRFSRGRWGCGRMAGYTNRGAGTSLMPVRFNAPPEVAFITLRRFKKRLD